MSENDTSEDATPATPAKRLDYAPPPPGTRLRRWARDTFSKEQLLSALKQFAWVAPLTILIWVYAEREQQSTARGIRFAVELTSNNEKVDVRLLEPSDGYVSADFAGPRARLDDIRGELGNRGAMPVRFEVPRDLREGEHQIPVTAVVNRDARFDGLTVANSEPTRIAVYVDPIDEEIVPVAMRDDDAKTYDQVTFSPERVRVRIPRQVKKDALLKNGGRLVAYANLNALPDKSPGRKNNVPDVPVHVAGTTEDDGVKVEPKGVSVSLNVRQADEEYVIKEVPVSRGGAGRELDAAIIDYKVRVLFDVRVVGPPERIAEVRQKPELVEAWLTIDPSDINAGTRKKTVWFKAPPSVKVYPKPEDSEIEVNVTSEPSGGS